MQASVTQLTPSIASAALQHALPLGDPKPETWKKVYNFYTQDGTDEYGKTLGQIRRMGQHEMARDLSFLQGLFPTYRPSNFDARALTMPVDISMVFRDDMAFMINYRQSFYQVLNFMGLNYDDCKNIVQKGDNFTQHSTDWLIPKNPFYASLTRILMSLNLFGMHKEAEAFNNFLQTQKWDNRIDFGVAHAWEEAAVRVV